MTLPPMHPALVHLPIAFFILSFVADVVAKITRRESVGNLGFWALAAALLGAVLTIAAGYWDMNRATLSVETHRYVDLHLIAGWALAACLAVLMIWRWRVRQQARRFVTQPYVFAAMAVLALTLFQGWYGGEMVFSYGAGVAPAGQGTEPAVEARHRLARVRDALSPLESAVGGVGHKAEADHGHGHDAAK
jgi:uncharacterized membrane protein